MPATGLTHSEGRGRLARATRLHARVLARLTGADEARRSERFFVDQGAVVTVLVALSVIGSVAVAAGPFVLRHLVDVSLPRGHLRDLAVPIGLLGALLVFESAVLAARMALIARLGGVVSVRIRQTVNTHLQRLPFAFFPRSQPGEVMTVMTNDVLAAQNAISATVQAVICRMADIAVGLVVVFVLDWRLSLAVMVFAPATLLMVRSGRRRLVELSRHQRELDGLLMARLADTASVSGALHVRLFDRVDHEREWFDAAGAELLVAARDQARLTSRVRFLVNLGVVATMTVVVALGAWLVSSGRTTLGTVAALGGALLVSFGPLSSAIDLRTELAGAGAAFRRIFALLDVPEDEIRARFDPPARPGSAVHISSFPHKESPHRVSPHKEEPGPGPAGELTGEAGSAGGVELALEDVWFAYDQATGGSSPSPGPSRGPGSDGGGLTGADWPGGARAAAEASWDLRGVTLRVAAGTTTAVVGASGAGKTTIAYLASGMHRPQRGAVRLDGVPLDEIPPSRLHAQIGVVPQDPHLFHDTIAANLRYGRLDATDDELLAALDAAHLSALLERLPDGLETRVGARGYRLSGGERQRLAIARVLLQSPRVLILDEATSALDTVSEAAVRAALDRLAVGRTCLVIAHRLSTVMHADQIYVLDRGRVVQHGTHHDLLADGGAYARLYRPTMA
ncbi:ABC transporter ATP-binding protein [Frankia sp. AiPa1]|uniref:ABC transporter ATP-binding protein n=1 Tax=Frankia sp. AiPa1 TaxID=573492 RepID=UPI00202B04C0|nr:ATP-binding cassette domain-containing protein [Frankia sp. AiPa1]MCL9758201.1 ABC transporter ATP-binding protein/permease [Frankia sp. AiPa1]